MTDPTTQLQDLEQLLAGFDLADHVDDEELARLDATERPAADDLDPAQLVPVDLDAPLVRKARTDPAAGTAQLLRARMALTGAGAQRPRGYGFVVDALAVLDSHAPAPGRGLVFAEHEDCAACDAGGHDELLACATCLDRYEELWTSVEWPCPDAARVLDRWAP